MPTSNITFTINIILELATDDYIASHGRDGNLSDHAYTLSRLRKEERLLRDESIPMHHEDYPEESGREVGASQLDMVDEMYDNLNAFD
jgi:hypothetical protein